MNNHIQRRNAATFAKCQANYDNMQHPDYYAEDPPPCDTCGHDSEGDQKEGEFVCPDCVKEWYTCPVCEEEFDYKSETDNRPCDDVCKSQYLDIRNEKGQ